ncbi:hypothetical protein [Halobacterium wangiae]|uniref:hypothetical protein n=1 Tax=Halobacterium wangiae TaxID=2902623 RepID=UPI001E294C76|nr:hypothetical protein [Halobacterium wangiae]
MNIRQSNLITPKLVRILAAVVIGFSIGAVLPPDPAAINALGTLPGVLLAGTGVIVGVVMYVKVPGLLGAKSCGCTGECACAAD